MTTDRAESFLETRRALAADPLRPLYHFLPPAGWMNDPNGMIQWKGRYHLFYQHNPYAGVWGSIHWGHAVSEDLVHWDDLPIALTPTPDGCDRAGCWSGCAVDDGGTPTLLYTGRYDDEEPVCLATGRDDLVTWEKCAGNPVIAGPPAGINPLDFRDPYVWREDDAWMMVLGSGTPAQGAQVLLYRSPDLRDWEYLGPLFVGAVAEYGSMWECPNFFPLGDKHVLIVSVFKGSCALYFVGAYADHKFTPERQGIVDSGDHFFAPQVMLDAQQRRVMFGWVWEGRSEEAHRAAGWAGVMSVPRVLSLAPDKSLISTPAPELAVLRGDHAHFGDMSLGASAETELPVKGSCLEILAEFAVGSGQCGLKLCCAPDGSEETRVGYDAEAQAVFVDRRRASLSPDAKQGVQTGRLALAPGETVRLHIYLDRSMVEVFANDRCCVTSRIYPTRRDSLGVKLFAGDGSAHLTSLDVWTMRPVWPDEP